MIMCLINFVCKIPCLLSVGTLSHALTCAPNLFPAPAQCAQLLLSRLAQSEEDVKTYQHAVKACSWVCTVLLR